MDTSGGVAGARAFQVLCSVWRSRLRRLAGWHRGCVGEEVGVRVAVVKRARQATLFA
jgi:hypothetical protein